MLSPGTLILTEGPGVGWLVAVEVVGGPDVPWPSLGWDHSNPAARTSAAPLCFPSLVFLPPIHSVTSHIPKKLSFSVTSRFDVFHLYIKILADYNYNSDHNHHYCHNEKPMNTFSVPSAVLSVSMY